MQPLLQPMAYTISRDLTMQPLQQPTAYTISSLRDDATSAATNDQSLIEYNLVYILWWN